MVIGIVLALLSGVTRTVGRMVNAQLSEQVGALQSAFFNYLVGLCCALSLLFLDGTVGAPSKGGSSFVGIPAWIYLGGVVGVAFVVLANITTPRISAYPMTLLIFIGQISAGVVMEAVLDGRLSPLKAVGGLLILGGLLVDRAARGGKGVIVQDDGGTIDGSEIP